MHFQALSVGIRAPTHHFNGTVLACSARRLRRAGRIRRGAWKYSRVSAEHRSDRRETPEERVCSSGLDFETDGVDDECV